MGGGFLASCWCLQFLYQGCAVGPVWLCACCVLLQGLGPCSGAQVVICLGCLFNHGPIAGPKQVACCWEGVKGYLRVGNMYVCVTRGGG